MNLGCIWREGCVADAGTKRTAAPAQRAGAARNLLVVGAVKDIVRRALRLGCRVNQKLAIVATFLE